MDVDELPDAEPYPAILPEALPMGQADPESREGEDRSDEDTAPAGETPEDDAPVEPPEFEPEDGDGEAEDPGENVEEVEAEDTEVDT